MSGLDPAHERGMRHWADLGRGLRGRARYRESGERRVPQSNTQPLQAGRVVSDLEQAQEWLGCERYQGEPLLSNCWTHVPGQPKIADLTWPCSEATRLAALLAEVRAEAWDEGKHSEHTPACRAGDFPGECSCENPYRSPQRPLERDLSDLRPDRAHGGTPTPERPAERATGGPQ